MPRRNRCVVPGLAWHITQRGVDRREVFSCDQDRTTYLRLLREKLKDAATRILGYCLMSNDVHVVAVPEREDSLSVLLRRVHGRYAQYYHARTGRSGHLWQNRFFASVLGRGGRKWDAGYGVVEARGPANWAELLKGKEAEDEEQLRGCTYAGRPFGEESFVSELAEKFGRYWTRGRPRKEKAAKGKQAETETGERRDPAKQFPLF